MAGQAELKKNHLMNRHFIFTTETRREAEEIVRLYREEREAPFPVRRIK